MAHRNKLAIDLVMRFYWHLANEVCRDLMAMKIEINPARGFSALLAAKYIHIESSGGFDIQYREGQMECRYIAQGWRRSVVRWVSCQSM